MKEPLLLLVFLILTQTPGFAQNEAGCEVLSHSRFVNLDGGKLTQTDSVSIMIFDKRGENYTHVGILHSKDEKIGVNYGYIEDKHGNVVRKLKKSEIEQQSYITDNSLYQDYFVRFFRLKHNVYPYKISYSYTRTNNRFLSAGSLPNMGEASVKDGRFTVQTNLKQPVKYKSNIGPPKIDTVGGRVTYTWEYDYRYEKPEVNMDTESRNVPGVLVNPYTFTYGVNGSWDSWETYGDYIYRLNQGLDALPDTEKKTIDRLLTGVANTVARIRTLYHYLQDYNRYVNVTLGIGGLKSYPAKYVCTNRYGDCKALSNYMVSMLEYAGIQGYYTIITLDENIPEFDVDFPAQVFNHVIVTVPVGRDTLYLECTSKNGPFNYVGTSIQGRKALLVKKEGSHLIDMPALSPEQVEDVTDLDIYLKSGSPAEFSMRSSLKGKRFEVYNAVSGGWNKNHAELFIRYYTFSNSFELDEYNFYKTDRDSECIKLDITGEVRNIHRRFGKTLTLAAFKFHVPVFESPETRRTEVRFNYPRLETYTIRYHLDETSISALPEPFLLESPYGDYRVSMEYEGNVLTVRKKLLLKAGTVTLEQYPEFYQFISQIGNQEVTQYSFNLL